jgi:hypothetical protein
MIAEYQVAGWQDIAVCLTGMCIGFALGFNNGWNHRKSVETEIQERIDTAGEKEG